MSQRDRDTSGVATATAPRPAEPAGPTPRSPCPDPPPNWDDYFPGLANPPVQVPAPLVGLFAALRKQAPGPFPSPADRMRHWLPAVLAGESVPPPLVLDPAQRPVTAGLDSRQSDAIARALATPDLCLVQGLAGTGRTRVIVEAILQAISAGQRVLLVGSPPALGVAIERLTAAGVLVYRAIGRDEHVDALPAVCRDASFAGRNHALCQVALPAARTAAARPAALIARWEQEQDSRARLSDLAARVHVIGVDLAGLQRERPGIEDAVRQAAEVGDAAAVPEMVRVIREHESRAAAVRGRADAEVGRLREEAAESRRKAAELEASLCKLRPLAEAKQGQRWLSGSFWKATFAGDVVTQAQETERELARATTRADELEAEAAELIAAAERAEAEARAGRADALAAEVRRRQAALDEREAASRAELAVLTDKWQQLMLGLTPELPRPSAATPAACEEATWLADRILHRLRADAEVSSAWAEGLVRLGEDLPARLPALAAVVAATPTGLATDPLFGDPAGARIGFDLLVCDDAQELAETDFLRLSRRARRQLLVGDTTPDESPEPQDGRDQRRGRPPARGPRRPCFFARLWQRLHCDSWAREGDRLVCRLQPVPAEERDRLESEPVADFPDTELRITSPAGGPPAIAEVVFPPGMSLRDAKAYLFRELEQLALGSRPGEGSWSEVGGKVLWSVGSEPVGRERLELAPGVTELVAVVPAAATARTVPLPWTPPAVEFDSAAGWDRESAEGWLRKHQRFPDAGRTVRLEVPHRHRPGLAAFLADVVYPNESRPPAASASDGPDVLFLPVPGLPGRREEPDANGQADHPPPSPRRIPLGLRGGAGLEIDLSDPRQRERIPTDLRGGLPERGMVNLAEAQAIARFLDAELSKGEPAVTVAVLAMTAAQAELTRRVCRQSPALAARLDRWVVDVPPAVRHREFDTVVVSLTRSHTHRAVPFGEAAGWLALALTRPRTQLVIVGDPGTLARRAQWESSLDHLNERQAAREREQVSALVRYLTGQESGDHFRLLAGYRC